MANNFPNLMKNINPQIQETQRSPRRMARKIPQRLPAARPQRTEGRLLPGGSARLTRPGPLEGTLPDAFDDKMKHVSHWRTGSLWGKAIL